MIRKTETDPRTAPMMVGVGRFEEEAEEDGIDADKGVHD